MPDTMTEPSRHILGSFHNALEALKSNTLMMASLTERSLHNTAKGLFERDEDLCNIVIADDEEIDLLEIQVDRDGIDVMMRYQPVASDLRQVVSAMKLSVNIERIADQAVNIARRVRKLVLDEPLPEAAELKGMFEMSTQMFHDAIEAFASGNLEIARGMKARDKELDAENARLANLFAEKMPDNHKHLHGYLNLIFIARFLERVGDHAKNICEDVVFAYAAEDIRHVSAAKSATVE